MKNRRSFLMKVVALALVFVTCMTTIQVEAATGNMWLKKYYLTVNVGKTGTIAIKANTTGSKVTYTSSNKKIATVSSKGVVTGVKAGKATITVKAGNVTRKCIVTVKSNWVSVKSLSFKSQYRAIDRGQTIKNELTIYPSNASNQTITYTSSNPKVAEVDSDGNVTGIKKGEVIITAKASNGVTESYELDVTQYKYVAPVVTEKPTIYDSSLVTKHGTISLGMTVKQLENVMGKAGMILDSEFNCPVYIYNSDYEALVFVYVKNNKVIGYYTNAKDFETCGVKSGITPEEVDQITTSDCVLRTKSYSFYMMYGDDKLTSALVYDSSYRYPDMVEEFLPTASEKIRENMEKMCIEILNGYRGSNGVEPVENVEAVSAVARNHSIDMTENKYFDHVSLDGRTIEDRLVAAGIVFKSYGEIITMSLNLSAIDSMGSFMYSDAHRALMLKSTYTKAGAGITFGDVDFDGGNDNGIGITTIMLYGN